MNGRVWAWREGEGEARGGWAEGDVGGGRREGVGGGCSKRA